MTAAGRHIRPVPPASAVIDQFPYPVLVIHRPAFIEGHAAHAAGGYRSDNPCIRGTIERHEWRAGWDYGDRLRMR
jgi:hypothetical protein